jgi:superfamily II DNA helicase RecQ
MGANKSLILQASASLLEGVTLCIVPMIALGVNMQKNAALVFDKVLQSNEGASTNKSAQASVDLETEGAIK